MNDDTEASDDEGVTMLLRWADELDALMLDDDGPRGAIADRLHDQAELLRSTAKRLTAADSVVPVPVEADTPPAWRDELNALLVKLTERTPLHDLPMAAYWQGWNDALHAVAVATDDIEEANHG